MLKNYTDLCDDLRKSENHAEANLKFALSRAHKYKQYGNFDDLVSAANYGLVKAAQKYDPSKGVKFISYAVHWIDKYIKEYLSERSIRVPYSQTGKLDKVNKMIESFSVKHKRKPTTNEICKALKMKTLSVNKTINGVVQSVVSLNDAPVDDNVTDTFEQLLIDERQTPEDIYDDTLQSSIIKRIVKEKLTHVQALIIKYYFFEDMNFTEISERIHADYKTVRDGFKSAMDILKCEFKKIDLR